MYQKLKIRLGIKIRRNGKNTSTRSRGGHRKKKRDTMIKKQDLNNVQKIIESGLRLPSTERMFNTVKRIFEITEYTLREWYYDAKMKFRVYQKIKDICDKI